MPPNLTDRHIGVDTGGTFTDVVCREPDGTVQVFKILSTPADPSRAIVEGIFHFDEGQGLASTHVVHGSTVATNALLERRGARVAFLVTAGFEDILELRRQNRPYLYTQQVVLPRPLVDRENVFGIQERVAASGEVLEELSEPHLAEVVAGVSGFEAVAICLLHSYANPAHETRLAAAIRARHPGIHVSVSHEILREFREYERASTTTINAYVGPVMARYLANLRSALPDSSVDVIQSNGGCYALEAAAEFPVNTVLSGPAGGVVGAWAVAEQLGIPAIIGFDMGGTSTDVSLCRGGLRWTSESQIDGIPVRVPVVDIHTVGAGGGSVAWRDAGLALRVGPRSAGASPGPACYGQGGRDVTVTDANLYLGRLPHASRLAGAMALDVDAARQAIERVAGDFGVEPDVFALGVIEIANAAMVRAIKVISVERGDDPRDCALVSFGGAGGLHACALADELEIRRVVVPAMPGLLSAYGMLRADALRTRSRTVLTGLDVPGLQTATAASEELGCLLQADLPGATLRTLLECRYDGQSFELAVALGADVAQVRAAFEVAHQRAYGYVMPRQIVIVNVRVTARIENRLTGFCLAAEPVAPTYLAPVVFETSHPTPVVSRSSLIDGSRLVGPAVITEYSSTTLVPPGWEVTVQDDHLILERR